MPGAAHPRREVDELARTRRKRPHRATAASYDEGNTATLVVELNPRQHGGAAPLEQTTVEPCGTTTVVCEGGGGLLLLKLRQPPSARGTSRISRQRIIGDIPLHEINQEETG